MLKKGYKNKSEKEFYEKASKNGWFVTRSGFPDFICWKNERLIMVEVKSDPYQLLRETQKQTANLLIKHNIMLFKWNPVSGFKQITDEMLKKEERIPKEVTFNTEEFDK